MGVYMLSNLQFQPSQQPLLSSNQEIITEKEVDYLHLVKPHKDKYVQFSEEQKARFNLIKDDKYLSKRFLSHLFGSSFIRSTVHEGWFSGDALIHMITILNENEISDNVTKLKEDLEQCLSWHLKIFSSMNQLESPNISCPEVDNTQIDSIEPQQGSELLEDLEELSILENATNDQKNDEETENVDEVLEKAQISGKVSLNPLDKVISEMQEFLLNLKVGEKLLFPAGCLGHAVLYEIKRTGDDEYLFAVYNPTIGFQNSLSYIENEGDCKVLGLTRLTHIKGEKILENGLLEKLLDLENESSAVFYEKLYSEVIPDLEGTADSVLSSVDEYMLAPRAGICSWKMLSAYCKYNLPSIERKYIKLKARLDVFQKWSDLGKELDAQKISQNLLEKLIINHKFEFYKEGGVPTSFSREELLTMGIYKAKKTFNRYKMLLNDQDIKKAESWYKKFTGQSIHAV